MKCSQCNAYNEVVQLDWIAEKKVSVEGFKCKECQQVNICRVTDNALRIDLFKEYDLLCEIRKLKYRLEKHRSGRDANTKMGMRIIEVDEEKLNKLETEYKILRKANNNRCKVLIQWYSKYSDRL